MNVYVFENTFANYVKLYYNTYQMTHKYIQLLIEHKIQSVVVAVAIVALSITGLGAGSGDSLHSAASEGSGTLLECCDTETGSFIKYMEEAQLLRDRLSESGSFVPSVKTLAKALDQKQKLLTASVTVIATDPSQSSAPAAKWVVSIANHTNLVEFNSTWVSAGFGVNEQKLAKMIDDQMFARQQTHVSSVVKTIEQDNKNILRIKDTPVARDGYVYDADSVASLIASALQDGRTTVDVTAPFRKGVLEMATADGTKKLDLLSTGVSDYSFSPPERVWNVHKAIDERVNNIVVKPGQIFSFVDSLNAPVTIEKGWKEGLGLFGGGAALTPGAGICQAATTVFRAALLAGLPIVERRNHSMWVDHYESFGGGLDATIFPGVHDLRFRNDTTHDIVIQAYIDGDLVYVNFYGTKDDRTVTLEGPYFYNTTPKNPAIRPLGKDQTGWVYRVTGADGTVDEKVFISTYHKGMPRFVFEQYAGLPGEKLLTDPSLSLTVAQKEAQKAAAKR